MVIYMYLSCGHARISFPVEYLGNHDLNNAMIITYSTSKKPWFGIHSTCNTKGDFTLLQFVKLFPVPLILILHPNHFPCLAHIPTFPFQKNCHEDVSLMAHHFMVFGCIDVKCKLLFCILQWELIWILNLMSLHSHTK